MSSILVWKVIYDGESHCVEGLDLDPLPGSLNQASAQLPGGAYTTFRTYKHDHVICIEDQYRRLEETCQLAGFPVFLERKGIRDILRKVVSEYPDKGDLRIRVSVDLDYQPGTIYILLEALKTPTEQDYFQGVQLVTCDLRRNMPKAKLTNFILDADQVRIQLSSGVEEAIMLDQQGRLLEGLTSNFFAIKDEVIHTAEQEVLSGITRALVIEQARSCACSISFKPLALSDLAQIQEAFITSASRGVLPVRQINKQVIGDGMPGPVTRCLMAGYQARIMRECEPL